MPDQDQVGGEGALDVQVQVVAYKDRPGIGRIFVAGQEVFNGDNVVVGDVTVTARVPFHTHFISPSIAVVWKEPQ